MILHADDTVTLQAGDASFWGSEVSSGGRYPYEGEWEPIVRQVTLNLEVTRRRLVTIAGALATLPWAGAVSAQESRSRECNLSRRVGDCDIMVERTADRIIQSITPGRRRGPESSGLLFSGYATLPGQALDLRTVSATIGRFREPPRQANARITLAFTSGATVVSEIRPITLKVDGSQFRHRIIMTSDSSRKALELARKSSAVKMIVDDPGTNRSLVDAAYSLRGYGNAVAAIQEHLDSGACAEDSANPEGCFITTACAEAVGLADNCFELRTLRRLRDHDLMQDGRGRAMVELYYQLSPVLLSRLPKEKRATILRRFYTYYVIPSALCGVLGLNALSRALYAKGALHLLARYAPDEMAARHEQLLSLMGPRLMQPL